MTTLEEKITAIMYDTLEAEDVEEGIQGSVYNIPQATQKILAAMEEERGRDKQGCDEDCYQLCAVIWKREPDNEFVRLNYPQFIDRLKGQFPIPPDTVTVPREPSEAMLGEDTDIAIGCCIPSREEKQELWAAMISAAAQEEGE